MDLILILLVVAFALLWLVVLPLLDYLWTDEETELEQRLYWDNLSHDLYVARHQLEKLKSQLADCGRLKRRNAKLEREAFKQWKKAMKRRARHTNMLEFYTLSGKSREQFARILAISHLQLMREFRPDAKAERRRRVMAFRSLPPFPLP